MKKRKPLLQWLGLLGVIGFLSYGAAVFLSPLAYPGYNWTAQAVSDLSASAAPSRLLWNQLGALYGKCALVCSTLACVFVQGRLTKPLRLGVYLFALMNWVGVGFDMFPLSEGGSASVSSPQLQDIMHLVVTGCVVLLSVLSLALLTLKGWREYRALACLAGAALILMLLGGVGSGVFPQLFGVFERFSVFSAAGFNAVLGVFLFLGFPANGQSLTTT